MEKTRVPKGERYWYVYIDIRTCSVEVNSRIDNDSELDRARFYNNDYSHTEEEAEAMVKKLRAVLKGAEVYTFEEITEIKANAFADGMEAERRKINREVI